MNKEALNRPGIIQDFKNRDYDLISDRKYAEFFIPEIQILKSDLTKRPGIFKITLIRKNFCLCMGLFSDVLMPPGMALPFYVRSTPWHTAQVEHPVL